MSIKSWFDEFERRYDQPQINNVTIGFSGIDPSRKDTSELVERISHIEHTVEGAGLSDTDTDSGIEEVFDAIFAGTYTNP